MTDLIGMMFSNGNVQTAMLHMLEQKNTIDSTGLELYRLPEYWLINQDFYKDIILKQCYLCEPVSLFNIEKRTGGLRTVANIPHIDMLLSRMLYQIIAPIIAETLQDSCFSFVPGKSVDQLVNRMISWLDGGMQICAHIDISDYFKSISHNLIAAKLKKIINSPEALSFVNSLLNAPRILDGRLLPVEKQGLLQGNPVSPILSNLYLNDFDTMQRHQFYVRYCDDLYCCFSDETAAREWQDQSIDTLRSQFGLRINNEKSCVTHMEDLLILGYRIRRYYNHWKAVTPAEENRRYSTDWQSDTLSNPDRQIWIVSDGRLSAQSGSIEFHSGECGKNAFPSETVDTIHVLSRASINTSFYDFANQRRIRICYYDRFGNFAGDFVPACFQASSEMILAQARICDADEKRLPYAKAILKGALFNIIYVLQQYNKRDRYLSECINRIRQCLADMGPVNSVSDLMLIEARARREYYAVFNIICRVPGFLYTGRTRRPPLDPINALLSFGNTVLYNRIATEIRKARMEISLSVLHKPAEGRNSLALDIAEVFKPLIVDRSVFSLINRHELSPEQHFERVGDNGICLNAAGKKIFINELNRRMNTFILARGRRRTWFSVIRDEVYRSKDAILKGAEYSAYIHR